ncbi:MAG: DUF2267 domain-containing protein [Oscillatoria sp. PMC 1051.18]|nr:DUF2267 domain-containing protein [Oscillatoria sp. PMC 1050.18]MEC5030566.1 DUF2267 domain-containing protein [Oscillatoria sp. PMC 1051.18]
MSATGLSVFDETVQKTNIFVNEVAKELNLDKDKAFRGLRIVLHKLRDRIPVNEAVDLGSQLPIFLAGFYYESWKPAATPTKERSQEAFFHSIESTYQSQNLEPDVEIEKLVRAVFKVLSKQVNSGEIKDVVLIMPAELKELFPQAVRA